MAYQATMIFALAKQGWSETWYLKDAASLLAADLAASLLATARRRLLGDGARLEAVRVSDADIIGDSHLTMLPTFGVPSGAADQAGAAVLVRIEAGGLYRRSMWLRGCPDEWIDTAGVLAPNVAQLALGPINAFIAAVIAPAIRVALKVGLKTGTGATGVAVTGASLAADGDWTAVAAPALGAALGERILMRKWKGPDAKALNRGYEVVKTGAGGVTINLDWNDLIDPPTNYRGRIYSRNVDYAYVTSGIVVRAAIRKTGRAFFVPAGRRYSARG